jgi:hypothetical protein
MISWVRRSDDLSREANAAATTLRPHNVRQSSQSDVAPSMLVWHVAAAE